MGELDDQLSEGQQVQLARKIKRVCLQGHGYVQIRIVKGIIRFIGMYIEEEFNPAYEPGMLESKE
jgi:hypothetical protein